MQFDQENKVILFTMNQDETRAFIKFLYSEVLRHMKDIEQASNLIADCMKRLEIDPS